MKPNKPTLPTNQLLFALCIIFLGAFLSVTLLRPTFHATDIAVNLWMPSIQANSLTLLASAITVVFDTTSLVIISLVIAGLLFLRNRKPQGLLLLGAMGGDALIVEVIKALGQVDRPTNALLSGSGFSYPSGHSAGIVVFGGMLAYFAWRHWHSTRSRAGIGVGLGVLVGVVGFDRVYLNAHWVSDVLGGWLFGAFWLSFVVLVFGWLGAAGKFQSKRFSFVAGWLYVVALVVAVLLVVYLRVFNV